MSEDARLIASIYYELKCITCGTAAYQPNDQCKNHISAKDRLQTEVEMHNAWRKRAEEAEALVAARDQQIASLQRKIEELETRVAPSVPCVETAGSTAEQSTGVVTAAKRPEDDDWQYHYRLDC